MQSLTDIGYLCVPPVRRNGPRESSKESIEAAETDYAVAIVTGMLTALDSNVEEAEAAIGTTVDSATASLNTAQATVSTRS